MATSRRPAPLAGAVATAGRLHSAAVAAAGRLARVALGDDAETPVDDPRFADPEWCSDPLLRTLRRSYHVVAEWLEASGDAWSELDPDLGLRTGFAARQLADALSPANFGLLNPTVRRETVATGGANLVRGASKLAHDLARGRLSQVAEDAFVVGRDLATTPGSVVLRTELVELIQYHPTTAMVYPEPILMIPPWINKFYILDLAPQSSMVRHLVAAGHTVFMLSWRNPGPELRGMEWDDYLVLGPLSALDAIGEITGADRLHLVGYCLGGLLLETLLAYLAAVDDRRPASATFFTTPQDFSDPGAVAPFLGPAEVALMEAVMAASGGYLDGRNLGATFNSVRARDLVWPYVVSNYWLGREPPAVDLLFWNADSTRVPAAVHSFLVRRIFLEDRLTRPDGLKLLGVPIDLGRIQVPSYVVATEADHVVPWRSAFRIGDLVSGPVQFVLGGSGHIAGIINPPAPARRGYRIGDDAQRDPEAWYHGATHHPGSWWSDWLPWLAAASAPPQAPPQTGCEHRPPLAAAPGTYVLQR